MYFFSFLFFLLQNWRTGGQNKSCPAGGLALVRVGSVRERGLDDEYSAKKCVYRYVNAKMIPVETTPGIGEGRRKEKE
jgi:hypothetical protein